MPVQQEAKGGGGEFPEAEPPLERPHRIEKDGCPGEQREEQVEQRGAEPAGSSPKRTQEIIGRAEQHTQDQRTEKPQKLNIRIKRHAQPKSLAQRPPERAGSS